MVAGATGIDLLAVSVDAALLDELYADIYESLVMRDQGGAVCRVREVEKLGGHVESLPDEASLLPACGSEGGAALVELHAKGLGPIRPVEGDDDPLAGIEGFR